MKPISQSAIICLIFLCGLGCKGKKEPATLINPPVPVTTAPAAAQVQVEKVAPITCDAWTIVPNACVGNITPASGKSVLIAMFGKGSVTDTTMEFGDDGEQTPVTVVLMDDPEKELQIIWTDSKQTKISRIVVIGKKWHTKNGIGIGTTLKELESINGKPFTMMGFAFDGEGGIINWNGGSLDAIKQNLSLGFRSRDFWYTITKEEQNSIVGVKEFSSSNPVLQKINPGIGPMYILW